MPPVSSHNAVLRDRLLLESLEMIRYVFASGKSVPTSVVEIVEQFESHPKGAPPLNPAPLVLAHSRLTRLVAPATPRAIVLLADGDAKGRFAFLGPVALVRQLMVVAIACVAAFVVISLFEATGTSTITFVNTWGWKLLVNEVWWLTAAGVGASFAILFRVNEYIAKSNYNPRFAPTYWVKFLLGVMAGYILVALLPFDLPPQGGLRLIQPAIALLGGYSASAVYRILTRLVEAVEAIFRGDARAVIAEREQAAIARISEEASRGRVRIASRLVEVQRQLAIGATPDEVAATVRDIMVSLTAESGEVDPAVTTAQAPPPAVVTVDASPQAIVAAAGRRAKEPELTVESALEPAAD